MSTNETGSPRGAENWAKPVSKLHVEDVPAGAKNLVEGKQLVGPIQGFGKLWQKTYRVRLELAELIGRLDPVAPSLALVAEFRALRARSKTLRDDPDPRRFAQINMDFFVALMRLTANQPLREMSERLYFRTTRIWLKSVFASLIDLKDEVEIFDREIDGIVRAIGIGDLEVAALIRRAHVSMSFERMRKAVETRSPVTP